MNDTSRRISYKCTERNEGDFLMFYILQDLFANKINSVLIFFFKSQKTLIGFDLYSKFPQKLIFFKHYKFRKNKNITETYL